MTDHPCQYVILHGSCRNRPGIAAVQAAHASTEAIRVLPVPPDTYVCVLALETSQEIENLSTRLTEADIFHVVIREPDAPYNGAAVALGIEVTDRARVKPFVADLKVFR